MWLRKPRQDTTYSQSLSTLSLLGGRWTPSRCPGQSATSRATLPTEVCLTAPPVPASVSLVRADVACLSAVLVAEIVHHYFPKLVELHNYRHVSGFWLDRAQLQQATLFQQTWPYD